MVMGENVDGGCGLDDCGDGGAGGDGVDDGGGMDDSG